MHQVSRLVAVAVIVLLGLAATIRSGLDVSAQEATPVAAEMAEEASLEGVSFEFVSFAPEVDVPSPADLIMVRIGLDPGASLPFDDSDPVGGVLLVESGVFTVRVDAPWTVTRSAGLTERLATAEASGDLSSLFDEVAADEEVSLEAGDAAYIPGSVNGEIRNDGDERAIGLGFLLEPSE